MCCADAVLSATEAIVAALGGPTLERMASEDVLGGFERGGTGASFMSFVGLLMRLLETTDGMLILFYRSITLAGMVGLVACLRRRQSPVAFQILDADVLVIRVWRHLTILNLVRNQRCPGANLFIICK